MPAAAVAIVNKRTNAHLKVLIAGHGHVTKYGGAHGCDPVKYLQQICDKIRQGPILRQTCAPAFCKHLSKDPAEFYTINKYNCNLPEDNIHYIA